MDSPSDLQPPLVAAENFCSVASLGAVRAGDVSTWRRRFVSVWICWGALGCPFLDNLTMQLGRVLKSRLICMLQPKRRFSFGLAAAWFFCLLLDLEGIGLDLTKSSTEGFSSTEQCFDATCSSTWPGCSRLNIFVSRHRRKWKERPLQHTWQEPPSHQHTIYTNGFVWKLEYPWVSTYLMVKFYK
jgi:hypothetical protein